MLFIGAIIFSVASVDAVERGSNTITRDTSKNIISRTATNTKTGTNRNITARSAAKKTVARSTTTNRTNNTGEHTTKSNSSAQSTNIRKSRAATLPTDGNISRTHINKIISTKNITRPARATITMPTTQSNTFGTGYNSCRDAYFTCMDQFCATANDSYRRCICSSKLNEIQSRERALIQASDQLQDFANLNIAVIDKTGSEVKAMLTASEGELIQENITDNSDSASHLAGISDVLSKTKKKSLSTQGTLDIAGDINAIWSTTSLTGGNNIANLTGESLYNAVHAQCAEMVSKRCGGKTTLDMVVSAYGMYIENDCSAIINSLDKQLIAANSTIRETEREMNVTRLENYNAHNSTSINDCIAQVRIDITGDNACGTDYVHCLDITGQYLNYKTGEPIYTAEFYKLGSQISLHGDILTNQTNRVLVATLNKKREFAKRGLDTCRDLSDEVWDEFMRQAITEIYQGQQERIRQVKNECLDVVSTCYDEQTQSLKDFSNIDEQLLLGSRLELSEQMCKEKLNTCNYLYGNGTNGMKELLTAMHNITDEKIAKQCLATLQKYAKDICAVPSNDTKHAYPYNCRVYAPGSHASYEVCPYPDKYNSALSSGNSQQCDATDPTTKFNYDYEDSKKTYTKCAKGYYLQSGKCEECPGGYQCGGGTCEPIFIVNSYTCTNYKNHLYTKMIAYASQACVRPSESTNTLPSTIIQDVSTVMDQIRIDMAKQLSAECENWDGVWVETPWSDTNNDGKNDTTNHEQNRRFYRETNANTDWGFCAEKKDENDKYLFTITFKNKTYPCTNPNLEYYTINLAYGDPMPEITPPTCEGYTFNGYNPYYNATGNPLIDNWDKTSDAEITASWKKTEASNN